MNRLWITTAEVMVQPGDVPSGETIGFMRVTMWASSQEEFLQKLEQYFTGYEWKILSTENTEAVDTSVDYGDEVSLMIEETLQDQRAVRLGTFYSYKPH